MPKGQSDNNSYWNAKNPSYWAMKYGKGSLNISVEREAPPPLSQFDDTIDASIGATELPSNDNDNLQDLAA
jgi:hypothetical protein